MNVQSLSNSADILIVDDQLHNLRLLSALLTREGYRVRKTTDGALALQAIQLSPPDLLLLDVMMPGEYDGYQVCSALKSSPQTRDIPIIFLSALDDSLDKVKAFNLGACDYITKPFQHEEVLIRVSHQLKILDQQRQLQEQYNQLQVSESRYRQMCDRLQETQQLLEAFFAQSLDAFYIMTLDEPISWGDQVDREAAIDTFLNQQRIIKTNAAMLSQYKASETELLGQTLADFSVHDVSVARSFCQQLLEQGHLYMEFEERRLNGAPLWVEGSYTCLYDADGRITGHFGIQRDISERHQIQEQIKASLREKTALLQEVHHRVKNNLQVVCSLLRLQTKRITDPQVLSILEDSYSRVMAMSLVHQSVYQSKNFAEVDLAHYVKTLCLQLYSSFAISEDQIQLHLKSDATAQVPLDKAVPCGLILNELITNAFKHGFPHPEQGGELTVSLTAESPDLLTLAVANNGVPMPPNFDLQQCQSMGLKLVALLTEQLDGKFMIETGELTCFRVVFNPSTEEF